MKNIFKTIVVLTLCLVPTVAEAFSFRGSAPGWSISGSTRSGQNYCRATSSSQGTNISVTITNKFFPDPVVRLQNSKWAIEESGVAKFTSGGKTANYKFTRINSKTIYFTSFNGNYENYQTVTIAIPGEKPISLRAPSNIKKLNDVMSNCVSKL